MQMQTDVPLKDYSTMRLGGNAKALTIVHTQEEMLHAIQWANDHRLPIIMIGGGSNIVWQDQGFPGLVIVNGIKGYREQPQPDNHVLVTVGAGETWDDFVDRVVAKGYTGVEGLSLIPGSAGATPVQNVGAYGQEIADTLVSVRAYDLTLKKMVTLTKDDCQLAYRSSRFKTTDRGRFFITEITLCLTIGNPQPPFYPALQQYLDEHHITTYTPHTIRQAVIAVRSAKLPDPKKVANNGSFFANPIISKQQLDQLQAVHGAVTHWPVRHNLFKIPAAWLVQEAGFKNYHDPETGMATWPTQAIVLVNEHAPNTAALLAFMQKIVTTVQKKFGITLEPEPEIL